jgi:NAD(P)-dependent dehydrogenase (short-subunit alcohol dehydrogenase family)
MIFSKALAKQLAKQGIRVNAVAPGPVWTPLQVTGGQTHDKLTKFGADTPMGRPGQRQACSALRRSRFRRDELFERTSVRSSWRPRRALTLEQSDSSAAANRRLVDRL